MRLPIDTALIVVDTLATGAGAYADPGHNPDAGLAVAALLSTWRDAGMPVIHVGPDPGADAADEGSPGRREKPHGSVLPELTPRPGERAFVSTSGSAFVGTGLEAALSAGGHTTLVVCGALTHLAVATTVRHAGCLGFRVFVPADACRAAAVRSRNGRHWSAGEVHAMALATLDGDYAVITDTAAAIAAARLIAAFQRGRAERRAAQPG
ncbi:MAG: isochorismatase family protein [Alsobacter sp.]